MNGVTVESVAVYVVRRYKFVSKENSDIQVLVTSLFSDL
jgi:hypothetical protein